MHINAEAGTQWTGQQSAARGRADQRKRIQIDLDGTGARPLVNHYVNPIVFHRTVKVFLHHRRQAVNLIDKQHVIRFQRGKYSRQIPGLIQYRTRRNLKSHAQFIGNDI